MTQTQKITGLEPATRKTLPNRWNLHCRTDGGQWDSPSLACKDIDSLALCLVDSSPTPGPGTPHERQLAPGPGLLIRLLTILFTPEGWMS